VCIIISYEKKKVSNEKKQTHSSGSDDGIITIVVISKLSNELKRGEKQMEIT